MLSLKIDTRVCKNQMHGYNGNGAYDIWKNFLPF